MPFKFPFSANLSTMFEDEVFKDRFNRAKDLGFKAVEAQNVYDVPLDDFTAAKMETGLEVALINSPTCSDIDYFDGEAFGLACIPGQEINFSSSLLKAVMYANNVGCKKIHVLAGLKLDGFSEEDLFGKYKQNMLLANELFEEHDIVGLIEPICFQIKELYFMDTFPKAVEVITEINSKHLKLLLDVYHLHMLERDVEKGIRKYLPYAGHVQISQAPGREEPFYRGDIDYDKVFALLTELKYDGHIGLEYTPSVRGSEVGFTWLERFRVD